MASRRDPSREELQAMKRVDLQKLAKDFHIKANLKTDALVDEILRARLAQSVSRGPTASPRRGQPDLDEQENLPKSKLAAGTTDSPGRVRKGKDLHAKLGVGRPRLAGGEGARKTSGIPRLVIPPGVVAANPGGESSKGKGRQKKVNQPRGVTDSALVLSKSASLEDVREDEEPDSDAIMRTPRNVASPMPMISSSTQRLPSYPDSTLVAMLDTRVAKLEDENDAAAHELNSLRHQLRDAQENIAELIRQNEQLRLQVDTTHSIVSTDDISDIFARLRLLEDRFTSVTPRHRAASISSSEADLSTPPMRKADLRTPPNQIGLISRGSLAPAFSVPGSRRHTGRRVTPLRLPTEPRRNTNPDESPSPTRPTHPTSQLSMSGHPGTYGRNSMYIPPNLGLGHASAIDHSRRDSGSSRRSRISMKMEDTAISLDADGAESDGYEREHASPETQPPGFQLVPTPSRTSTVASAPLPYPMTVTPSPQTSEATFEAPTVSRSRRSMAKSRRSHPYRGSDGYESPDPLSAPITNPVPPRNIRDLFGTTPDPTRIPPLPKFDGKHPVLNIGGGRRSQSATFAARETPQSSPMRGHVAIPSETPPASRTRYGTEIGSAMRARFSDNEAPAPWRSR